MPWNVSRPFHSPVTFPVKPSGNKNARLPSGIRSLQFIQPSGVTESCLPALLRSFASRTERKAPGTQKSIGYLRLEFAGRQA